MQLADMLAEDRRLVVLRALAEMPGRSANESVVKTALGHFGHRVGGDIVRADLRFLADHGLVNIGAMAAQSGALWIATLRAAGEDVAEGRREHPGVARRGAE